MRVLVLGARGMLGSAVVRELETRHPTARACYGDYDVRFVESLINAKGTHSPDAVINCAGIIPAKCTSQTEMYRVNAEAPHKISEVFSESHVVLVSTDCVFSGSVMNRPSVEDIPDPVDGYGCSKRGGELRRSNCSVMRTSFVGTHHGLAAWFASQPDGATVDGWIRAWWAGSTVHEVARWLVRVSLGDPVGLQHLATSRAVTKFQVLHALRRLLNKQITIRTCSEPVVYRALQPTPGFAMRPFSECAEDLV